MVADAGRYDTGALPARLFGDYRGCNAVVLKVEMRHGFIEQYKVEGLAQRAHYRESLLLADRHFPRRIVAAEQYAQLTHPVLDLPF